MNTYWRLLGFAKPIEKYAIPYFFYTLFYSLFNTFNFVMIIPILNSLFDPAKQIAQVTSMPAFALNMDYFDRLVNFLLYKIYGPNYSVMNVMLFLSIFIVSSALLSNMFRYLGQWTIENMKIHTLRRLRNAVFDNVMGLHVATSATNARATSSRRSLRTSPSCSSASPTRCRSPSANRS